MAFTVQIKFDDQQEKSSTRIEPSWWSYKELLGDLKFDRKKIYGSVNYYCELYKDDFINVFLDQMKNLNHGLHNTEHWKQVNSDTMEDISELIEKLQENDQVAIIIYEWES